MKEGFINHSLLRWAREEANLSLADAAIKAGIQDLRPRGQTNGLSASQRLEQWEEGSETPSFPQLERIAKAYRRPVLTFFLVSAPRRTTLMKDFRTFANAPIGNKGNSPEFAALIRGIEALQKDIRDLCDQEGKSSLPFVGSITLQTSIKSAAESVRNLLQFPFEEQQTIRNRQELFSVLREKAEKAGVYVVQQGNLGSHHTKISPENFRGLAISDPIAPLIVINPLDVKAAKIFSFLHELTHICLGETGYSNMDSLNADNKNHISLELFCNKVAGEFLVPESVLRKAWKAIDHDNVADAIQNLSRSFKVSRLVIGRRLLDLKLMAKEFYWNLYRRLQAEWNEERDRLRDEDTVVSYRIRILSKFGRKTIDTVMEATRTGQISLLEASRMLNVKVDNLDKL